MHPWERDYKLPKHVVPKEYNLLLFPDLNQATFTGNVNILLNITSECDYIVLHRGLNLAIDRCTLATSANTNENLISKSFPYPKNEFWIIQLTKSIPSGTYHLKLYFTGSLTDDIVGFYKSTYKNVDSADRSIATTKFEPTYARRAFPCFDEPCFKAKYNVQLVRPSEGNYIALSNMNPVNESADSPSKGLTTVTFATSVPMSTYIACFIVCDFAKLPSITSKHGFDVTVYARNSQISNMKYTLQNSASTVEFYINYFSIDYPLPKLDLIAIPDFVSGAMENWGLITFRETSVLYDPEITTGLNHLTVTLTTAHELAHMWFGNLVTMKWWDDLWLNEGFASFVAFKGASHVHPDWDMDMAFIWFYLTEAIHLDSTLSSHPIIKHVSHPDQITEIFDTISYSKGASMLRMMESFLGEENFRKGVVSYLKTFSYSNAETKDLWHHLQKFSSGINVERVMDTWTRQMGLPVLKVVRDGGTITITQQRFTTDIEASYDANESPYKYKWDVPVTYVTSEKNISSLKWMLLEDASIQIDVGNTQWYKLNWHFMGYYRVCYPPENWKALTETLKENIEVLDAADRTNIIDDAFALAESGHLEYSVPLSLIDFLQKENHFVVWAHASDNLLKIVAKLRDTDIYSRFRDYLRKLVKPLLKDSLWDFSAAATIFQRALQFRLLSLACKLEVPECLNKTKQIFLEWLENDGPKPHVELQNIVYHYGISESGKEQWDKLWERFLKESEPQEKVRMRNALCATKDKTVINRLLESAKNEQYIRSQDFFLLIRYITMNPCAKQVLWDWVRTNWEYLVLRFTVNNRSFGKMLPGVVGSFSTVERLREVETFLKLNPEEGASASGRKSAVESIKLNILWLQKHLPTFTTWLDTVTDDER